MINFSHKLNIAQVSLSTLDPKVGHEEQIKYAKNKICFDL